jgi:hypothetical protein
MKTLDIARNPENAQKRIALGIQISINININISITIIIIVTTNTNTTTTSTIGKLQKDFDRLKVNLQSLISESALIKITMNDNTFKNTKTDDVLIEELNNNRTVFQPQFIIHNTMTGQEVDDAIMAERERDIKKMNQDLLLVNEMFRDMASIVDKQGGQIEEIEKTTETSHERAKAGLEQVRQAANHQSSCLIS